MKTILTLASLLIGLWCQAQEQPAKQQLDKKKKTYESEIPKSKYQHLFEKLSKSFLKNLRLHFC